MNTKQHVLLRAAQLVLCCAAALAALLLSLEATLFKEGYLIKKLDEADYFDTLTNTVRAACEGYLMDARFSAAIAGDFLTPEQTYNDVVVSIDARFRGTGAVTYSRFTQMTDTLADAARTDTGEEPSEEDLLRYTAVQSVCEGTYQTAVAVPFDAPLSVVLQYRAFRPVFYAALSVMLAACIFALHTLEKRRTAFLRALGAALTPAGAAAVLCAAALAFASGYRAWMPAENMAHPAFCAWLGGFFPAFGLAGALLAAAGIALAVFSARGAAAASPAGEAAAQSAPDAGAPQEAQAAPEAPAARTIRLERAGRPGHGDGT